MLRILLAVMLVANTAPGQTYAEWFRQKKTQIKYLEEQIASLQAYALVAEKGYDIARSGLDAIGNIKKGDFAIHENYFSSLQKVNPNVKAYAKIAAIIALQAGLVKSCHRQRVQLRESKQFSAGEISYAGKVFDNLLDGCSGITGQLIALTTGGLLQMKDDERIKNIDGLYNDMQERYRFIQHFENENKMLAVQRMKEQGDVKSVRRLYGQ